MLGWIRDFLSDRVQSVCINNTTSPALHVSSGVPQGSVLGPLLLLIYIDGLVKKCTFADESSRLYLYADDA